MEMNKANHHNVGYSTNMKRPHSLFQLVYSTLDALLHEVENGHMNITPAEKKLLVSERIDGMAQSIAKAIKPKVASFLLSGEEFTINNLLRMCDGIDDRHQGVYADVVTKRDDPFYVRIYIGNAAGPYTKSLKDSRRDRGLHQRIVLHNRPPVTNRHRRKHEELLQAPGVCANWIVMVSFQRSVSRTLVNVAHAIMTILFNAYDNRSYITCRPKSLPDCPQSWGLNELGPLVQHSLNGYNIIRRGKVKNELDLVQRRDNLVAQHCLDTTRQIHQNRLQTGGVIHVNVLVMKGVIKRFFITPMTKKDGCHIDITIPRAVGLAYGLETSRSVKVEFELNPDKDHKRPYAARSPSASLARRLGVSISGIYKRGDQVRERFTHWIECNRPEATNKAETLAQKIHTMNGFVHSYRTKPSNGGQGKSLRDWMKNSLPVTQKGTPVQSHSGAVSSVCVDDVNESNDPEAFSLCFDIINQLNVKVQSKQTRAIIPIRKYLKEESKEMLARKIAESIQPGIVSLLKSKERFEATKLLFLKGGAKDKCQGVYADVVTSSDPSYARIYIGSAAGVYRGRKDSGLSRRIKEHLSAAKKRSNIKGDQLHTKELKKEGTQPNFVVLVRFPNEVELPVVRIAEALMVILFQSWDNRNFCSIRPRNLPSIPQDLGLNNANPLTGGFAALIDFSHPDDTKKSEEFKARCQRAGKRMASSNMARYLKNAREGGPVAVTRRPGKNKGSVQYGFRALKQQFFIPIALARDLGLELTRKVNVLYDISDGRPHQTPYAWKAGHKDPGRHLGIKLKGKYPRGPNKGLIFEKWLQCGSTKAVSAANTIVDLLSEPGT